MKLKDRLLWQRLNPNMKPVEQIDPFLAELLAEPFISHEDTLKEVQNGGYPKWETA